MTMGLQKVPTGLVMRESDYISMKSRLLVLLQQWGLWTDVDRPKIKIREDD